MDANIAEITINRQSRRITSISHHGGKIKFGCQRCAVFCCKLGPPNLSSKDVERLKLSMDRAELYLDERHLNLRRKENGSCIFLSADSQNALHKCSVYNFRPVLCRLYPFQFQKLKEESYSLKLITCCNGLNSGSGTIIDTKFAAEITESLLFLMIDCGLV